MDHTRRCVHAVLQQMHAVEGTVAVRGQLAYVTQQAWIQSTTLRNNILFGQPFDQTRYDQVVRACSLTHDLEQLPAGIRCEHLTLNPENPDPLCLISPVTRCQLLNF